jgi:hypothetical protein
MRRLLVVLAACQPAGRDVAMPANAPHGELPACSNIWTPPWASERCRTDRIVDVDGDRVADCMRVVTDTREVHLSVWPRCTGEPVEVIGKRAEFWADRELGVTVPITLPAVLSSPAWVRAIAELFVGADHVYCERPSEACPAPEPALAFVATFRPYAGRVIGHRFEPHWQDGDPTLPPIEALILDPDHPRPDNVTLGEPMDKARLVVLDPRAETLAQHASCPRYDTFGEHMFAVRDRNTAKWTWVYIGGLRAFDGGCRDDLVLFPHGDMSDGSITAIVRPELGTMTEVGSRSGHWDENLTEPIMIGHGGTGNATPAEVAALLVPDAEPLPPCADGPLEAMPAPCVMKGRGNIRPKHGEECWTAIPLGNRATGTLSWNVRIGSCTDETDSDSVDVDLSFATPGVGTDLPLRWLAELVIGRARVHCAPATGGCARPALASQRLKELDNANAGGEPAPLHWSPGSPVAPTNDAILMGPSGGYGFINYSDEPGLVLINVEPPAVENRPPQPVATCGKLELWSSPEAVAVREPERDRWAYVWIAGAIERGFRSTPIARATCEGDLAVIELRSGELGVVELATGRPAFFELADVAKLRASGDAKRAKLMHDAIVFTNDRDRPR